jgi:DNA processing protein
LSQVFDRLVFYLEAHYRREDKSMDFDNLLHQANCVLELCRAQGIKIVSVDDSEYPENLRNVRGCPELLFMKGCLTPGDRIAVAIVGTRNPTIVGQAVAAEIAADLAAAGVTIVSGLAYGIDACAHSAALNARGRTIACLGHGVDQVYPKANWALYREIAETGALLSEYLPGTGPRPWHFPERNRLISGLSLGVVVVEAGLKSGALITADWALKHGRPVMCVPGSVKSAASQGTNRLIQEGAYLVTCAEDVLSFLRKDNEYVPQPETGRSVQCVSLEESLVLNSLARYESVEDICDNLNEIPVYRTMSLLSALEVKGYVKSLAGGKYVLTPAGQKLIT